MRSPEAGLITMHIHNSVLTKTSAFFAGALKPEWRPDPKKPLNLEDETLEMLQLYVQWLYTRTITYEPPPRTHNFLYARLYVLGNKFLDPTFQNVVIAAFIENVKSSKIYPSNRIVKTIYDGTMPGSPARRLCVDFWTHNGNVN